MLKVHRSDGPSLELRIVRDGVILRHALVNAVDRALTVAQLWRIECELGWGPGLLSESDDADDEMRH